MYRATMMMLLALIAPAHAQDGTNDTEERMAALNKVTIELMARHRIPGIGIVGVKDGNVAYVHGFGTADGQHAFDAQTRFYIASNTKAFTGLAMASLIRDGRIKLDDPVTKFIPRHFFPSSVDIAKVTVRNLLAHTTGLVDDALVSRTAFSGELPKDLRTLLRFTEYRTDDHSQAFKYSNLGYLLSGMIIEEATGESWKHYVQQTVLAPAGMSHTSPSVPGAGANVALPFEAGVAHPMAFRKTNATMHAAGGLYSTLPDMGHWLTLFTDPHQTRIPAPHIAQASAELVDEIGEGMGPFKLSGYGYGWIHGSAWGKPLRFHFGSFPGHESMMSYSPDDGLGVLVYVAERKGGLRVAAALSSLYYDVMRNDPAYAEHLGMLQKMIAGTYSDPDENPPAALTRAGAPGLCGRYDSDEYGTLTISDSGTGYQVQLGDLSGDALRGDNDDQLQVGWIPGKLESFEIKRTGTTIVLQYGQFDDFVKRAKDTTGCSAARTPTTGGH